MNHMDIGKNSQMIARESLFWISMNSEIKNTFKHCTVHFEFQQSQARSQMMPHEELGKTWEIIGADIFQIRNRHVLCIIDYSSKFPLMKHVDNSLSVECLLSCCKAIF